MTLRELHYLVALAEKRHFGHAAAACHVGQPTLSMQIKKLEEYLGVSLFERDNHHVSPTPIGDNVVGKARIALEAVAAIRELARQAHEPMDGLLRIGAIPTLAPFLVPDLIPKVKRTFPNLRLLVREATTTILIDAARSYKLDALLLTLPLFQDYLDCQALFHEPLKVALPTGHELAASSAKIDRSALDTRQLLLLTEGHCLRDQVWRPSASPRRCRMKITMQAVSIPCGGWWPRVLVGRCCPRLPFPTAVNPRPVADSASAHCRHRCRCVPSA